MSTSIKISQSVINDFLYNSEDQSAPASCPLFLKYRHLDKLETPCSPVMLAGKYFEWHLLGATRDMIEPIIPKVGVKDLRPKSSDSKETISKWLEAKGIFMSGGKELLLERVKTFPPELSEGSPSAQQAAIDDIIIIAKQILALMGLDTTKGDKQVRYEHEDLLGHIDWITKDFKGKDERDCIIDVKYTETQEDDRYNGWADFQERTDMQIEKAKTQAAQYLVLHHAKTGKWVPYYFFIFGKSGWIKIIQMNMLPSGLADIQAKQNLTRERIKDFVKKNWKAKPEYNKCLSCSYAAYDVKGDGTDVRLCPSRAIVPTVEQIEF